MYSYGHLLTTKELSSGLIEIDGTSLDWKTGLTDDQIDILLQQDIQMHGEIARRSISTWNNLNNVRKIVVLEMAYGLGEKKLEKFHNITGTGTLDLIEKGLFGQAADALVKNKRLFGRLRREEMSDMLRTGKLQ